MDKPLAVGDLVMVVRGHPCILGRVGTVEGFDTAPSIHCTTCGGRQFNSERLAITTWCDGVPISWLKRIDPLSEPESVTEEATA